MSELERWLNVQIIEAVLPARYFPWRFRGNSLTLSQHEALQSSYDVIIATSMTDLSSLRGFLPHLATVPTILYFHENQFAYPDKHPDRQVERQITSIYSAIAADRLVFNSDFNRRTFLEGSEKLLRKMPDGVPSGTVTGLKNKSEVISVPIDVQPAASKSNEGPLSIVWNHRWEHDKGLEDLQVIVEGLLNQPKNFIFHLIGQSFRQKPAEIQWIKDQLGGHLGQFGFVEDRSAYRALLGESDRVLSTAHHEFQGIAVLEAMSAGCEPVVPNDLAYQEFVPEHCRFDDLQQAVAKLVAEPGQSPPDLPRSVLPEVVSEGWQYLISDMLALP